MSRDSKLIDLYELQKQLKGISPKLSLYSEIKKKIQVLTDEVGGMIGVNQKKRDGSIRLIKGFSLPRKQFFTREAVKSSVIKRRSLRKRDRQKVIKSQRLIEHNLRHQQFLKEHELSMQRREAAGEFVNRPIL